MRKLKKTASVGSKRRTTKPPGSSSVAESAQCFDNRHPVKIAHQAPPQLLFPTKNFPDTDVRILNSCNGLLCLYSGDKSGMMVHVCNPVGVHRYPVVNTVKKFDHHLAFGFSSVSNQYKVLQTFYPEKDKTAAPCLAEIYTVGTGQWRSIGNAPYRLQSLDANAFLHDSIHWIEYRSNSIGFVSAFDFVSEQFKLVPLPPASQIHDGMGRCYPSSVGVIKGCLFMTNGVCIENEKFEIWVMEEYGIKESWTKKFVLSNLEVQHYVSYQPLYFLSSGEILLCEDDESIGVYVPKLKRIHEDKFYKGKDCFLVTAHNPSFVSLQDVAKGEELTVLRKSLNSAAAAIADNQNVRVDSCP
ncbi:LOW QUALITY PROTEIN: F-box protein [Populus alba x Populus x berolinensis]|uniref:F-box protein n=1 Tax=Populus alba x Populus x berolinensis TaxID=444605 RepID=A0AAD6Q5U0_9ROSI|nr:LOW QUALITY PROTEIN: F-box protein [Populus alba x Populus x berolinensis]